MQTGAVLAVLAAAQEIEAESEVTPNLSLSDVSFLTALPLVLSSPSIYTAASFNDLFLLASPVLVEIVAAAVVVVLVLVAVVTGAALPYRAPPQTPSPYKEPLTALALGDIPPPPP